MHFQVFAGLGMLPKGAGSGAPGPTGGLQRRRNTAFGQQEGKRKLQLSETPMLSHFISFSLDSLPNLLR